MDNLGGILITIIVAILNVMGGKAYNHNRTIFNSKNKSETTNQSKN